MRAVTSAVPEQTHNEFEQTFHANWHTVYRVLVRLVGDADEAQDLALETFWRLYRQPLAQARAFNLGGWLHRVATNLGLNALRARKRRTQYELASVRENANEADALEAIQIEEERARVRAVLSAMDARQAQLLILRHSGLSYKELANALDVSVNSVGTLLVRAEREFEKRYREKEQNDASQ